MTNTPRVPSAVNSVLANSWSPGDLQTGADSNGLFVSFEPNHDGRSSTYEGASTLAYEARSSLRTRVRQFGISASSYNTALSAAPVGSEGPAPRSRTPSQMYLDQRRRRVTAILIGRRTTTEQVQRHLRISRIVSGLATVLALGAALAAALTPLSGAMLLLSFAVLLVAQLGHAYSNARTARLLRQSAEQVRKQAFGCLELIGLSPAAAVLDARFPPVVHPAGEPDVHPWYEVRAGLMAAASWRKAACTFEKKGKKTLLSLARAVVLQLLKGPIAWLTVLNAVLDLFKLMTKSNNLEVGLELQELGIKQVLRAEIDQLREQQPELPGEAQIGRLRNLFVLECLLTLPNAQTIERRVDELQRAAGQDARSLDRTINQAESWALTQWQAYAYQHSDRALDQSIHQADMLRSVDSIRPQIRTQWVEDWIGNARGEDQRLQAGQEIERFLDANPERDVWP
jgi:hypothetical protein